MEKAMRKNWRAQVTKLCNLVEEHCAVLVQRDIEAEAIEQNKNISEQLLRRLRHAHSELKIADEKLIQLDDGAEDAERECALIIEYSDKAVSAIAQLEITLQQLDIPRSSDEMNQSTVTVVSARTVEPRNVKLKPLELKKFDGKLEDLLPFWEQFKISVHENNELQATTKFNFLSDALQGRAAALIAGFLPSESCYKDAVALLREEFGNPEKIVEKYLQKLIYVKNISSASDIKSMRNLYSEISATIRSLEALKIDHKQYDLIVRSTLLRAMPTSLRIQYHRLHSNMHSNEPADTSAAQNNEVKVILEFLKTEVEALEKSQLSEKEQRQDDRQLKTVPKNGTATSLFTSAAHKGECIFCKKHNHATKECRANLTIEERKQILKQDGRCFRCANKGHMSQNCRVRGVYCNECKGRHITSLCEKVKRYGNPRDSNENSCANDSRPSPSIQTNTTLNTLQNKSGNIYLQTAKAIFMNTNKNKKCISRLIMDNGSQRTYITEALQKHLNLASIGTKNLQIVAFGEKQRKQCTYNCVNFIIKSQYDDEIINITAVVVPSICIDTIPVPKLKVKNIEFADVDCCEDWVLPGINLLIGQDHYWRFNTGEIKTLSNELVLANTKLGWTIQGNDESNDLNSVNKKCQVFNVHEIENEFNLEKFWDLESIGIKSESQNTDLKNECKIDVKWQQNRYTVTLPWVNKEHELNNNKFVALKRLRILTMKLFQKNKMQEYNNGITELINNGIAEIVPETKEGAKLYYMPHMAVWREDKETTKMRIVFDASSSEKGVTSLNDHLHEGHNMIADLLKIMLSFRSNLIALTADIEKAFLQVALNEEERDSHRFLWYKSEPKENKNLPLITHLRMTRVTFGVSSSPFLLAMTIKTHLKNNREVFGDICCKLQRSFYVDDLILSVNKKNEAETLATQAYNIMKAGNFNLRKWSSNDATVLNQLPADAVAQMNMQKVLGVYWCTATDELSVDVAGCNSYISELSGTKRNVLKAMARVFDPLGMLGPFTVRIKILLQRIWSEKSEWDQLLRDQLLEEFSLWQHELAQLSEFSIKRSVISLAAAEYELHIFCDASLMAFGAVAYVRQKSDEGKVSTMFVCAKNRIRPLKKSTKTSDLTLPKLELTTALIAARLKKFLIDALEIDIAKVNLWSDSTIALTWIRGQGKAVPYVRARVEEINELTSVSEWNHCPGASNPADLLTRGIKATVLNESDLWKHGPEWLCENEYSGQSDLAVNADSAATMVTIHAEHKVIVKPIFNIIEFSTIKRLLRATAIMFKFVQWIRDKGKQQTVVIESQLSHVDLRAAELYWVKSEQAQFYADEIEVLSNNKNIQKSKIASLNPTMINGIIRLHSRLAFGVQEENFPIILPKRSHLSKLLIREAHQSTMHGGVNTVLAYIRKRYWIVQGRQAIKNILRECVVCKRLHGKAANEPWTSIPRGRVSGSRAFETTGVDFAGPLYVQSNDVDSQQKVYILLFTCAAIRAVHLELVPDMTTKSCIEALRRFNARRGAPKVIMSDNAKTFKRTDIELKKLNSLLNQNDVQNLANSKGIEWKYIPERAAWWGGFWERLVRSIKSSLKAAVGKSILNANELMTVLTEVEAVINDRPLTYISDDTRDLQPLTPAHFLHNANSILISTDFQTDGSNIAKSWELRQSLLKRYIKRWRAEYLNQLRSLHHNKGNVSRSIKEGDVVLVHEDNKPRLLWKLALVKTTFPGRDGRVRACDVRLAGGQVLKRPVQLLYPLEIN